MNSVERVKALCKERKIAISKLERDLGFSNGYIGQLRKGVFPADRLDAIANYFGVSTDYLLGKAEQKETPQDTLERKPNRNVIKIAGRDGSFKERVLTDEQLAALAVLIDQLPDVPDDL